MRLFNGRVLQVAAEEENQGGSHVAPKKQIGASHASPDPVVAEWSLPVNSIFLPA
jgi:hypothetical protein